ncbi:hypothetical protein NDU88_006342 [Pleurodeles waltl]|uniref:Uncharacterized protein n=1 Tax=Pleurodeles waltl TaxID=8319 RepID=A0AAV7TEJ3_PLEWA|nr:hypothetical protein NDU88_006342 [Pleurodeles waltl]
MGLGGRPEQRRWGCGAPLEARDMSSSAATVETRNEDGPAVKAQIPVGLSVKSFGQPYLSGKSGGPREPCGGERRKRYRRPPIGGTRRFDSPLPAVVYLGTTCMVVGGSRLDGWAA